MQSLQVEKKDIKGERKIKETQREREREERGYQSIQGKPIPNFRVRFCFSYVKKLCG